MEYIINTIYHTVIDLKVDRLCYTNAAKTQGKLLAFWAICTYQNKKANYRATFIRDECTLLKIYSVITEANTGFDIRN